MKHCNQAGTARRMVLLEMIYELDGKIGRCPLNDGGGER
jgi:hypothetical protein